MTNPSELLRRYFEAYNAHDASALGRLVGDKITLSRPGQSASGLSRLTSGARRPRLRKDCQRQ